MNQYASAGDKEDLLSAMEVWAAAFSEDHPDPILALYDGDAALWGTLSPTRRDDPAAVRDYFLRVFEALPSRKVTFKDPFIRVYGSTSVNTGSYTFTRVKDGKTRRLPARYSFTYRKRSGRWMIVDHHSSAMPDPDLLR